MPSISWAISIEVVAMPVLSASPLPVGAEDQEAEAPAAPGFWSEEVFSELPHAVSTSVQATPTAAARADTVVDHGGPFTDLFFY